MKIIVNPTEYLTKDKLNRFVNEIPKDKTEGLHQLTEREYNPISQAIIHLSNMPKLMRYFEELLSLCIEISEEHGKRERTLVLGVCKLTPILIGSQPHYRGQFQDTFFKKVLLITSMRAVKK
ncbi:MAG: hypothetical protein AABX11_05035 [Nanoarchaeota archaeon]